MIVWGTTYIREITGVSFKYSVFILLANALYIYLGSLVFVYYEGMQRVNLHTLGSMEN